MRKIAALLLFLGWSVACASTPDLNELCKLCPQAPPPPPCEECPTCPDCPTPTPCPEPTPTPTPTPEPGCSFPQGLPEGEYTGAEASSTKAALVNAVMAEITGCNVGSRCLHGKSPQEWMQLVVAAIRERGTCAGQHIDGQTDEIAVKVDNACRWEGYHITTHGANPTVVWAPGAVRPSWIIPSRYCGDVAQDGCPAPLPDKTKFKINLAKHNGKWDATPTTVMTCAYCAEIGLGEMGGVPRCGCPMRPEGNVYRSACERYVLGGDPVWYCNGVRIESLANPYQASCNGVVRVCNVSESVCNTATW